MTTLFTGRSGIRVVTDYGEGTYPAWQPSRKISISKTVGGHVATMLAGVPPSEAVSPVLNCSQVASFVWGPAPGVEFCSAPNAGTGWGTEIYIENVLAENNRHDYNAVESGKLGDSPPLDGRTNVVAQGHTDGTGTGMRRIVQPAFWLAPGEETVSGFPALNIADVSQFIFDMTYGWGLGSSDNIITLDLVITIPTDPIIQSKQHVLLVPFFHYSPNYAVAGRTNKPFAVQEWVAQADGATRAYVGPSSTDTSTTEVLMSKSADDAYAMAAVYGAGALGDGGFYKGLNGGGAFPYVNGYGVCLQDYPGGVPAGTITIPIAICFGARADLIGPSGAIATAAANLAAASWPA